MAISPRRRVRVLWRGKNLQKDAEQAILRGTFIAAQFVRGRIIDKIIEGERTGRVYTRRGITHQASAPGEPPKSDTGNLVNSIDVEVELAALRSVIRIKAKYAAALEYGTQKMAPRPYARATLLESRSVVNKLISKELSRFLRR